MAWYPCCCKEVPQIPVCVTESEDCLLPETIIAEFDDSEWTSGRLSGEFRSYQSCEEDCEPLDIECEQIGDSLPKILVCDCLACNDLMPGLALELTYYQPPPVSNPFTTDGNKYPNCVSGQIWEQMNLYAGSAFAYLSPVVVVESCARLWAYQLILRGSCVTQGAFEEREFLGLSLRGGFAIFPIQWPPSFPDECPARCTVSRWISPDDNNMLVIPDCNMELLDGLEFEFSGTQSTFCIPTALACEPAAGTRFTLRVP